MACKGTLGDRIKLVVKVTRQFQHDAAELGFAPEKINAAVDALFGKGGAR